MAVVSLVYSRNYLEYGGDKPKSLWLLWSLRTLFSDFLLLYHINFLDLLSVISVTGLTRVRMCKKCTNIRGTQREYSSKPPKHSIVKRIFVFKQ